MKHAVIFLSICLSVFSASAQYNVPSTNLWYNNANIGIGTQNPQYTLDVQGQGSAYGYFITSPYVGGDLNVQALISGKSYHLIGCYPGWDANAIFIGGYNAGISAATGVQTYAQRVYFGNPAWSTNYMGVDFMTGGVGIGTTQTNDPNYRLFVEKGIRTRKVTVDQATWPDYVFQSDYRLLSLDSLRQYVQTNHHLPDVSSAEVVEKNGLDLGGNQAQLLKKVEELTLYILQQQQQIEAQSKSMQGLQAEIQAMKKEVKN